MPADEGGEGVALEMVSGTSSSRRRRRAKPGDLAALRRVLWRAVLEAEALLDSEDPAFKLRVIHSLATVGGAYGKAVEVADLEARLVALEAAQASPSRAAGTSPQAGPRLRGAA